MKRFVLIHKQAVEGCCAAARSPEYEGWQVVFSEPTRNSDQNAKFHAMCGDIAKQRQWMGKVLKDWQWKVLLISGHAVATKIDAEMVPGLEGEFVNIRESSARMGMRRMASLITYVQAWGDQNDVVWSDPESKRAIQEQEAAEHQ